MTVEKDQHVALRVLGRQMLGRRSAAGSDDETKRTCGKRRLAFSTESSVEASSATTISYSRPFAASMQERIVFPSDSPSL
jgi:hypothetical protein